MITPVKVPETPIIMTRPELEAGQQPGDEHHEVTLLTTDSPPPPLSPPLCDDPEAPGDQADPGDPEPSVQGQEAGDVPVATLVTTAWDGEPRAE